VKITEETDYPSAKPSRSDRDAEAGGLPFHLRIPRWCDNASIKISGRVSFLQPRPGRILTVAGPITPDRKWKDGDTVTLQLP